jgi:hypothetical protein
MNTGADEYVRYQLEMALITLEAAKVLADNLTYVGSNPNEPVLLIGRQVEGTVF